MARVNKIIANNILADVLQEKRFYCCDGKIVSNLKQLEYAFKHMNNGIFSYHVNSDKNDFSNWVEQVIGDEKLARDLKRSTSPRVAAKYISSRLAWLENKAGVLNNLR